MRIPIVLAALLMVAAACTDGDPEPDPTGAISTPIETGTVVDEDVVVHLAEPPSLAPPLDAAAPVESELRTADLTDRHLVYVVTAEDGMSITEPLPAGALAEVPSGADLAGEVDLSVAEVDGDVVTSVTDCPAPCSVTGPALVGPGGWLTGLGVDAGWELVTTG
jgi:hypothetical protein